MFFRSIAFGQEVDLARKNDTLESISLRNILRVSHKYRNSVNDYQADLRKWNPTISDWSNFKENQLIYIDYPFDIYVSGSTWAPELGLGEKSGEFSERFFMSVFYASSFGSYSEMTNEQTVTSGQNFPITLGTAFSLTNEEKKNFVVGSFYWAKASKGNVTGDSGVDNSNFKTPGEIGGNLYYQHFFKDYQLGFYTGYDFEILNTFNTSDIITGKPVVNIENKMNYLTGGFVKGFSFLKLNFNFKASISKTISSTISSTGTIPFTGQKYILNLTYKPNDKYNFNVFYKHHSLSGSTQLAINRIGFSVGFSLF
jgi:hypothetical protein